MGQLARPGHHRLLIDIIGLGHGDGEGTRITAETLIIALMEFGAIQLILT